MVSLLEIKIVCLCKHTLLLDRELLDGSFGHCGSLDIVQRPASLPHTDPSSDTPLKIQESFVLQQEEGRKDRLGEASEVTNDEP